MAVIARQEQGWGEVTLVNRSVLARYVLVVCLDRYFDGPPPLPLRSPIQGRAKNAEREVISRALGSQQVVKISGGKSEAHEVAIDHICVLEKNNSDVVDGAGVVISVCRRVTADLIILLNNQYASTGVLQLNCGVDSTTSGPNDSDIDIGDFLTADAGGPIFVASRLLWLGIITLSDHRGRVTKRCRNHMVYAECRGRYAEGHIKSTARIITPVVLLGLTCWTKANLKYRQPLHAIQESFVSMFSLIGNIRYIIR